MDLPTLLAELDALNFESEPARRLPTDDATPLGAVARHFNRLLDALEGAHDLNENLQIEIQQHAKLEEELRHARDNGDRAAWRRLLAVAMTAMELPHEERREMLEELKVTAKTPGPRSGELPADLVLGEHADKAPTRRLYLLVADDNPFNRRHAIRCLEQLGHSVVGVANGREAVTAAREHAFDLMFLDLEMPEMDGLEASATIRSLDPRPGARVAPIIGLSLNPDEDERTKCLAVGMDEVVGKPIEPIQLARTIERVLATSDAKVGTALASIRRLAPSDSEFVRELAQAFLDDTALHLAGFQRAIDGADVPLAHRSALSLKVLLASVSAEALSEMAQHAATAAAAGDLGVLKDLAAPLTDGLAEVRFRLEEDLRAFAS